MIGVTRRENGGVDSGRGRPNQLPAGMYSSSNMVPPPRPPPAVGRPNSRRELHEEADPFPGSAPKPPQRPRTGDSGRYEGTKPFPPSPPRTATGGRLKLPPASAGSNQEKEETVGSSYRYHLPNLAWKEGVPTASELRHMDVFCEWDHGAGTLDSSELATEVKYHRQYYTWYLQRRKDSNHVRILGTTWQDFLKAGEAALEQLLAWVLAIRPRSIHDYKPLVVLLQGAMKVLVNKELNYFSADLIRLRKELSDALALIEKMKQELQNLYHQGQANRWQDVKSRAIAVNLFNDEYARMQQMRSDQNKQEDDDRHKQLLEEKMSAHATMEEQAREIERLRALLAKREEECEDMERRMKQSRARQKELEEKNRELEKKPKELQAEIDTLNDLLEASKDDASKKLRAEKRKGARSRFQKATLESHMEEVKIQQDAMKSTLLTPFLNWAAFNPLTELEWAAVLIDGQTTLSIPWCSTLHLPKDSKLPNGAHIVEVPGGTAVETLMDPKTKEYTIALPSFSTVTFPSEVMQGSENARVAPVCIPGGSTIIVPRSAVKATIVVPPGTLIYPPEAASAASTLQADGDQMVNTNVQRAPRGGMSTITAAGGSTLVTPMGVRANLLVPSGCSFIFQTGQKRSMTVPTGTCLQSHMGHNAQMMIPSSCTLTLPDHDEWAEATPEYELPTTCEMPSKKPTKLDKCRTMKLQPEQPDCPVQVPGGTIVTVPEESPYEGGKFKVTLPPKCEVEAPKDEYGVPAKDGTFRCGKLPSTCLIRTGSNIKVPFPMLNITPQVLAERMRQMGPEATSAAIGGLDPRVAAAALTELGAEASAEILTFMRTNAAAQVVRRMAPERLREAMQIMSQDVVASILACFAPAQIEEIVDAAMGNEVSDEAEYLARTLASTADSITKAQALLSKDGVSARQVVDAMKDLDPQVTSRLIAGTQANNAAYVLSLMGGKAVTSKGAFTCVEQLHRMAKRSKQISTRYNRADIKRARLMEDLSKAATESSLLKEAMTVMQHLKEAYGIRCTIARMPPDELAEVQAVAVKDVLSDVKGSKKKAVMASKTKKGLKLANDHMAAKKSRQARKQEAEDAEEAADQLELLCSMEDVRWDVPNGDNLPGQTQTEEAVASGLAVEISPKVLADAQAEAFERGEAVINGVLVVVPVVLNNGMHWGTLSHINCNTASQMVLGGLGLPAMNSIPKAHESLELFAAAIAVAMDNIDVVTRDHYCKLVDQKDSIGFDFKVTFEAPVGEKQKEPLAEEEAAMQAQSYTYWRRRIVSSIVMDYRKESKPLEEIKTYVFPPFPIVLLMTAVLLILDLGVKGLADVLGPSLLTIPKDEKGQKALWKYVQSMIKVDPNDHDNIPRQISLASKGLANTGGDVMADDLEDLQKRVRAVGKFMMMLYDEQFESASTIVTKIMEWTFVQFKILDLELLQARPGRSLASKSMKKPDS